MQQNPYKSGEFQIADYWQRNQNTAAIFNNTIFVMSSLGGYPSCMLQTTFDLEKLIQTNSSPDDDPINDANLKNKANWTSVQLTEMSETCSKPSLASVGQNLLLFLNQWQDNFSPAPRLAAYKYTPASDQTPTAGWSQQAIQLFESDGRTIPQPYYYYPTIPQTAPVPPSDAQFADVSVTTFGENIVIVTCSSATSATQPSGGTFVGVYDTNDIDYNNNKWAAKSHSYLSLSGVFTQQNTLNVSTEWYSTVTENGSPFYNLAVLIQTNQMPSDPAQSWSEFYIWNLEMTVTDAGSGNVNVFLIPVTDLSTNLPSQPPPPYPMFFTDMHRDPGGRLVVWNAPRNPNSSTQFYYSTRIATTNQTIPDADFRVFSGAAENNAVTDLTNFPSSLFYTFGQGKYVTTVGGLPADNYPVYDFIFYGEYLKCQVNRVGTIQVIKDFSVTSPQVSKTDPTIKKNIIAGIINGPLPIPLENYADYNPGGDEANAGSLRYGLENSVSKSRSVSTKLTAGFEASGKFSKGVGPAFDISFDAGTGSVAENSVETQSSFDLLQETIIDVKDNPPYLIPAGSLRQVGAQISVNAFNYLDNYGPSVMATDNSSADATKTASVLATFVDPSNLSFTPYDVTPGDLTSYLPKAINERMQALGYQGTNYYGDIICKNAYPFGTPDTPFLTYSWSEGNTSGQSFNQFTDAYKENSWTLEASVYAGISGGVGGEIFGIGEEFEYEFLAGVNYSHESTESENHDSGWGVSISEEWGPPDRHLLPNSVKEYEFRVFFLPVPKAPSTLPETYWTEELIKYMPAGSDTSAGSIDPSGACWRIVYVVTNIQYRDSQKYPGHSYDNSLDEPSVYRGGNDKKSVIQELSQLNKDSC